MSQWIDVLANDEDRLGGGVCFVVIGEAAGTGLTGDK